MKVSVRSLFAWSPPVFFMVVFSALFSFFSYKLFPSEFFITWNSVEGVVLRVEEASMHIPGSEMRIANVNSKCWVVFAKYNINSQEHLASHAYQRLQPYHCENSETTVDRIMLPKPGDPIIVWYDLDNPNHSVYNKKPKLVELLVFIFCSLTAAIFLGALFRQSLHRDFRGR